MPETNDSPQPQPMRAIRLIFEYDGDQVRLVSRQPVDMAVTGFDLAQTEHPGYYVDVRSASDQTLARVPARDAFAGSLEVFPENPGEPITRVDDASRKGAFTVVVPAPESSDHVTIMQMKPGTPDAPVAGARATSAEPGRATAVDLVSFSLISDR
jgi:hypothetical protein